MFQCFLMGSLVGGGREGLFCIVEIVLCRRSLHPILGDLCNLWASYLTFLTLPDHFILSKMIIKERAISLECYGD